MIEGKLDILLSRIQDLEATQAARGSELLMVRQAILQIDPSLATFFEMCFERFIDGAKNEGLNGVAEVLDSDLSAMKELLSDEE